MTTLREAAQQALEALEGWDNYGKWVWPESALEQAKRNTTESLADLRAALENEFNPDWDRAEALEESLREHMAEIQRLRAALAEPVQEPVAWGVFDGPNLHDVNFTEEEAHEMVRLKGDGSVVKPLYTSTQPQMQPCAGRNCGSTNPNLHSAECFEDYEKATGMNQWQGLMDGEIDALAMDEDGLPNSHIELACAIEAKLREKNT